MHTEPPAIQKLKSSILHKCWLLPSSWDCQLWLRWWASNLLETLLNTFTFMPHKKTAHLYFFFLQIQNLPSFLHAKSASENYPDAKWLKYICSEDPFLQLGVGIYNLAPSHSWDFAVFCVNGSIAKKPTKSSTHPCIVIKASLVDSGDVWEKWGSARKQQDEIQMVNFRYIEGV